MILKLGVVSPEVIKWQKFLGVPQTGIFDATTFDATVAWQKAHGLDPDGKVGTNTIGTAVKEGYQGSLAAVGYFPPKPNFSSPSSSERAKMFGSFQYKKKNSSDITITDGWADRNIVKVTIPQLIGVEGAPKNGVILFNKHGADQLIGFFKEVERQGLLDLVISWAGSFYPRFVRGSSSTLSNHSWGTAFDINAPQNWLGQPPAAEGKHGTLLRLVPIANSFGFYWGGHYNSRLDGMHFELAVINKFPAGYSKISSDEKTGSAANSEDGTAHGAVDELSSAPESVPTVIMGTGPGINDSTPIAVPVSSEAAIPVQTVTAAPEDTSSTLDKTLTTWSARFTAIPGAILAALGTFFAWFKDSPTNVITTFAIIFGAIVIFYVVGRQIRDYLKTKAENELTEQREARAHDVQMALIAGGQNKGQNNVVLVPPATEMQNSDPVNTDEQS